MKKATKHYVSCQIGLESTLWYTYKISLPSSAIHWYITIRWGQLLTDKVFIWGKSWLITFIPLSVSEEGVSGTSANPNESRVSLDHSPINWKKEKHFYLMQIKDAPNNNYGPILNIRLAGKLNIEYSAG